MRTAGILMPITSLPSPYGVGTLGQCARDFIQFLHRAGQTYWQILPICPTGYGDSPYQSFSSYAGNPYMIDFDDLKKEGLLQEEEYASISWGDILARVDYSLLYSHKFSILRIACSRISGVLSERFQTFCKEQNVWLNDYALYMSIKDYYDGQSWQEWPETLQKREKDSLEAIRQELTDEILFWKKVQFLFFYQWDKLKAYAEENNIKIEAVGGTSAGSIVAALYAMGYKPYYIYVLFKKYAQDIINIGNSSIVNGIGNFIKTKKIGIAGLNDGTLLEKMFNELATRKKMKAVADIKMPLVIPAVDIAEAKEYIFTNCAPRNNLNDEYITEISIGKAIRASSSFPAYFCPCEYKKHIFMDGGVLDNTPILPLKRICKHKVMAVNFEADPVEENCDVMDIIMKTLDIMGNKIAEESFKQSDLVLTVPTDRAGLLDIEKMDKCYKFGYDTTMKNIDKIKKLIY